MYNYTRLVSSFKAAQVDESYYAVFFSEAEKYLRIMLPKSPMTAKYYNGCMEKLFDGHYDFDDLIQDCLLKLWECIIDLELIHTDGIETFIINVGKYKLLQYIKNEERRRKIAVISDISEAAYEPSNSDFNEETLISISEEINTFQPAGKAAEETIYQVDKKNYKKIAEFSTIGEVARETGISKSHISEVLSGKRKSAGGYLWVSSKNPLSEVLNV